MEKCSIEQLAGSLPYASTVLGGPGDNWCMVEIRWHRRETRRPTENTNIDLQHREEPGYST